MVRFLVGFKPLCADTEESLLRAMARTLIEARLVPVRKDAQRDPVELIAAALATCIDVWDREHSELGWHHVDPDCFWNDVAIRIAAFEALYSCRARDQRWAEACLALGAVLGTRRVESEAEQIEAISAALKRSRDEVAIAIASKPEHANALLAEIVVVGRLSSSVAEGALGSSTLPPFGRAVLLVRAGKTSEAINAFETILQRVPGHTLALEQAARGHAERGELARAEAYARRAFRPGTIARRSPSSDSSRPQFLDAQRA